MSDRSVYSTLYHQPTLRRMGQRLSESLDGLQLNAMLHETALLSVLDNTPTTAINLGSLGPLGLVLRAQDSVGNSDPIDYYSVTLTQPGSLNIGLSGLSNDADLTLYFDRNNNGVIESDEYLGGSFRGSTLADTLNLANLAAGRYFIAVSQVNGNTNYTLQVSNHARNNLLLPEVQFGSLNGSRTRFDFVGSSDTSDVYAFSLDAESSFSLSLNGLTANADVRLIQDRNGNGIVDAGEAIAVSSASGTSSEALSNLTLQAGNYFVQVYQTSGDTNYTLNLAAQASDNTAAGAINLGALTGLITRQDSVGVTDLTDFYSFNLSSLSSLNVALTGLSQDADLYLYYDANNNGAIDTNEFLGGSFRGGSANDTLNFSNLAAGRYFLAVEQYSGNTNYTLQLSNAWLNNLLAPEVQVGTLTNSRSFSGSIGNTNTSDIYRFSLNNAGQFTLNLSGLSNDADVRLIRDTNGNGVLDAGETLAASTRFGSSPEALALNLSAGDYLVQVYQYSGATNYTLQLSSSATPVGGFSSQYGYGLVDASAAVAQAIGQTTPFAAVPNLGGNLWNLDRINAPEVWAQGFRGQGVVVAVVDTGVDYTHPDLAGNIWTNADEIAGNGIDDDGNGYVDDWRGWDFSDGDNDPFDLDGHGTHVAGTIAAENDGLGMTGVAHDAVIMPVRVLDDQGYGYTVDIAAGIRYAVDNGADIINLSLGGGYSNAIATAIQYAAQNNVFVAIASGNGYQSQPGFPANLASQWGIAVGAVNSSNQLASFSNDAGPTPLDYVVAPGVNIYSTTPNNSYAFYSGTSMATPHVAGVAALMLSANPSLSAAQIGDILTATANPVGIGV